MFSTIIIYFSIIFPASPVITWEGESNSLTCYLNDTGGYEYLWASFTREDNRNITIGHCSRDSTQEYFHGGMTISFNRTQNTCTLELLSPNQQQDGGIYSCTLWIKAESEQIAIISHQKATVTSGVPDPIQEQVLGGVIGGGLGGIFVLLVLAAIAICYKRKKNGKTKVINSIL